MKLFFSIAIITFLFSITSVNAQFTTNLPTPHEIQNAFKFNTITEEKLIQYISNLSDINQFYFGDTVLHWAVQSNKLDLIKLLIDKGADVEALADPIFESPINEVYLRYRLSDTFKILFKNLSKDRKVDWTKFAIKDYISLSGCSQHKSEGLFEMIKYMLTLLTTKDDHTAVNLILFYFKNWTESTQVIFNGSCGDYHVEPIDFTRVKDISNLLSINAKL